MPHADVVVIGAGLAGLTAAARLSAAGAAVTLVAKGHATTHWSSGGIDVAAPGSATTSREGIAALARGDHPYALLAGHAEPALAWLLGVLDAAGLPYSGDLDTPIRRVPTAIGGTRRAAVLPLAQAAARRPWASDEILVVAGPRHYKDFWPGAVADSLGRDRVWGDGDRPAHVVGVAVDLPALEDRRNLSALEIARLFDDPAARDAALDRIARAVGAAARGRPGRVALPAVVGLEDHAGAWAAAVARLPLEPFEVPLVPPSVPGMRLYRTLRSRILDAGGRVQIGETVAGVVVDDDRVTAVDVEAAVRRHRIRTDAVILATGGIAGGGIVAGRDGTLTEAVLGLRVDAPAREAWLVADALDPGGHPVEAAGLRTDERLRPLDPASGSAAYPNVAAVGALLAGQRAVRERCGDGIAVASGWRAATLLIPEETAVAPAGWRSAPGAQAPAGTRP